MGNAKRNDFIDVYVIKTLNEIKNTVKSNMKLDKDREEEVDKKISFVLNDLINSNFKNLQVDVKGDMIYTFLPIVDEKENKKIRLSLALYYVGIYYDNVELLRDLLKEDVKFEDGYFISFQYLDKSISSKFDRKKYIEMIKTCGRMFSNFAKSIENLSDQDREKYIQKFERLINYKYDFIKDILSKDRWYMSRLEHIFEKNNLDTFTDETYKQSTFDQLRMMGICYSHKYSEETCDKLNYLMQTREFSNYLCNFDLMMKLYTDDELFTLNDDISYAINKFSETEESLNKILDFIQMRPDLARDINCISFERFMKTDNYTLIEVCNYIPRIYADEYDFDVVKRIMKPKAVLKRALGAYKKR